MKSCIAVGGDVFVECLVSSTPRTQDLQSSTSGKFGLVRRRGGAALLTGLIRHATHYHGHEVLGPLRDPAPNDRVHSLIDLRPTKSYPHSPAYTVERVRHIPGDPTWSLPPFKEKVDLRILVLEDPGKGSQPLDYLHNETQQSPDFGEAFLREIRPKILIYKMARPLATGTFWDAIRRGPYVSDGKQDDTRLIVIVDADDLRAEGLELSRHLSWERTAEDFVRHIASNGKLSTLVSSAHLIVRFDCDGVIHYKGRTTDQPTIYFDSENAEGDFSVQTGCGPMEGASSAFTAGLVSSLAKNLKKMIADSSLKMTDCLDAYIQDGILVGLHNVRHLASVGFSLNGADGPDYPFADVMRKMKPEAKIASARIPNAQISAGLPWSIFLNVMGDPAEIARYIVRNGPRSVLGHVPIASFGRLMTADRYEIESFRSITNLVQEYLRVSPMFQVRPLSIGAFGPPGSGKSFGVMEVIQQAVQGHEVKRLDVNMSQLADPSDLVVAFQQIRDRALSGRLPLVLFDEFDADLAGSKLGWLRYFLAPMQDGQFLDHGEMHPLGPAIFIFIGGTSSTLATFMNDTPPEQFIAAKGPDFVSRLRGFVNVLGPDQTPDRGHSDTKGQLVNRDQDRMYPIRRAILLRSLLAKRLAMKGEKLKIDDAVLTGLLTVPKFIHGARSLEAILNMSRLSGRKEFERAALPSETQLSLHVDIEEFMRRIRDQRLQPDTLRESFAQKLHAEYRKIRKETASLESPESDPAMRDWTKLSDELKDSNYCAADDLVRKLRLIECYIAKKGACGNAVKDFTPAEIDKLSQHEHERYQAERLQRHWRLGPRDIAQKETPFLKPWSDLPEDVREIDRALVRCIPRVLGECDYQVCRVRRAL